MARGGQFLMAFDSGCAGRQAPVPRRLLCLPASHTGTARRPTPSLVKGSSPGRRRRKHEATRTRSCVAVSCRRARPERRVSGDACGGPSTVRFRGPRPVRSRAPRHRRAGVPGRVRKGLGESSRHGRIASSCALLTEQAVFASVGSRRRAAREGGIAFISGVTTAGSRPALDPARRRTASAPPSSDLAARQCHRAGPAPPRATRS